MLQLDLASAFTLKRLSQRLLLVQRRTRRTLRRLATLAAVCRRRFLFPSFGHGSLLRTLGDAQLAPDMLAPVQFKRKAHARAVAELDVGEALADAGCLVAYTAHAGHLATNGKDGPERFVLDSERKVTHEHGALMVQGGLNMWSCIV